MGTIAEYEDLIKLIPVGKQSTRIRKDVWKRFLSINDIVDVIFENKEIVEISRTDVLAENNLKKKIIMTLMWGYPTGGRGNNIAEILKSIDKLVDMLSAVNGKNLTKIEACSTIAEFESIRGLSTSTWSKFLYFFNVSIESKECQIYDLKIVESLNKKQFSELGSNKWKQSIEHYYLFIELLSNLATSMDVLPEQIELFLFYFNLYYKFAE